MPTALAIRPPRAPCEQALPSRQDLPSDPPRSRQELPRSPAITLAHVVLTSSPNQGALHMRIALLVSILTVPACVADSTTSTTAQSLHDAPSYPAALTPAATQRLAFDLEASGVQIYTCT